MNKITTSLYHTNNTFVKFLRHLSIQTSNKFNVLRHKIRLFLNKGLGGRTTYLFLKKEQPNNAALSHQLIQTHIQPL